MEESSLNTSSGEGTGNINSEDSFNFPMDENQSIISNTLDVKRIKKFPYNVVGNLSVQFPSLQDEKFEYTYFLIDTNVAVTLASNIFAKSKGGWTRTITTSFREEKVK